MNCGSRPTANDTGRPLIASTHGDLQRRFEKALTERDGLTAAHCVHERWMRGEMYVAVERALERVWAGTESIPEWLPMHYVHWLPTVYEVASRCRAGAKGRSNIYLVLLDYSDSRAEPYGIYVGMTKYRPADRFDQHKAGIRAAGSVLKRGVELLTGPALHLQYIKRSEAERIETELAEALSAAGLFVKGGH